MTALVECGTRCFYENTNFTLSWSFGLHLD